MALAGVRRSPASKSGAGDYIDIMADSARVLPNVLGPVSEKRDPVAKHERSLGGAALYNLYRTKDGRHVALGAQEPKFVRNLLTEWGRPDLVDLCLQGPGSHQRPVIEFVQGVFATRTQAEWVAWFEGRDIAFAPVRTLREAFDDPHAHARQMRLVDELGQEHIGLPIKYRRNRPRRLEPQPGQHTVEVLRECGYDDDGLRIAAGRRRARLNANSGRLNPATRRASAVRPRQPLLGSILRPLRHSVKVCRWPVCHGSTEMRKFFLIGAALILRGRCTVRVRDTKTDERLVDARQVFETFIDIGNRRSPRLPSARTASPWYLVIKAR